MNILTHSLSSISNYFKIIWNILTRPQLFFRELETLPHLTSHSLSYSIAFALITHWISHSIHFLWNLVFIKSVRVQIHHLFQIVGDVFEVDYPGITSSFQNFRETLISWFTAVGPILVDPFITLFSILFYSFIIWMGARIFLNHDRRKLTYALIIKIYCYSMAASLFAMIPFFGSFLAFLFTTIIRIIGIKEVFQLSNLRATTVGIFPLLLTFSLLFFSSIFIFLGAMKFIWSFFY